MELFAKYSVDTGYMYVKENGKYYIWAKWSIGVIRKVEKVEVFDAEEPIVYEEVNVSFGLITNLEFCDNNETLADYVRRFYESDLDSICGESNYDDIFELSSEIINRPVF